MVTLIGILFGAVAWFLLRYLVAGVYTVDQNERAVKTVFGRAERLDKTTLEDPFSEYLRPDERERYSYPQVRVIPPGGPYFKWPWERIYKVTVATQTMNMALDLEDPKANLNGTVLDAVTKDQLNIGISGQVRYKVCERNLYAYIFAVKNPVVHVMGYFISILRERIANFEAPQPAVLPIATTDTDVLSQQLGIVSAADVPIAAAPTGGLVVGISINDLRKNLRDLNELMDRECLSAEARYGITFDASLITAIDPPADVESALAAINTAHNQVSSDMSLAHASADQKIVQSKRAVEIETLKAEAEVEPLVALAAQLGDLKRSGPRALPAYVRSVRLKAFSQARRAILEIKQ